MATNTLLNPDMITNEALRILHQKSTFLGNIDRQYDDSFAKSGAKINDTLRIRLPIKYTVRSGKTLSAQDTTEKNTSLQVSTQRGVDIEFDSEELTMSIDDFSRRHLQPAMTQLVADTERNVLENVYKDVYNQVADPGNPIASTTTPITNVLEGARLLTENLTPYENRHLTTNTRDQSDMVSANTVLYNPAAALSRQYEDGKLQSNTLSYTSIFENTLMPRHTSGSDASGYDVNGGGQTGSTLTVQTGTGTFKKGDIITIADVNRVHPETKSDTGELQQFVVTADYAGGGGDIAISPEIITSGAYQTVSGSPADTAAITKVGTAAQTYGISLGYHKDSFTFATADLIMPKGVDMASRKVYEGISLRFVRQFDITNDTFPARFDILYGYKTIRPETAVRYGYR